MTPQEAHCAFMAAAISQMVGKLLSDSRELPTHAQIAEEARKYADAALEEYQKRWPEDADKS